MALRVLNTAKFSLLSGMCEYGSSLDVLKLHDTRTLMPLP